MPIVQSSTYRCFARFTVGIGYAVGTDHEYRSGVWHDPVLARDVSIEQQFMAGSVIDPRGFDLVIYDAPLGTYQNLVAGGGLDGTSVVVETVCVSTLSDGTTDTQTKTATLTVRGTRMEPGRVVLILIDIEDTKLSGLYPAELWSADSFRDIALSDTGTAIPHPIGTVRKLRAVNLVSDVVTPQFFYGVCNAPLLTLPITAISTGAKTFTVSGNYTDRILAGTVLFASVSSANANRFTVTGAIYSAPNTIVTVSETIASATVSGNLLVPPTVLAVYRDGRLVPTSEYTVELSWPATTQLPDPGFTGSPFSWTASGVGTGSASLTGGIGRMTGDGSTTNYGVIINSETAPELQTGAWAFVSIDLDTVGRLRLYYNSLTTGYSILSGQGRHTGLIQCTANTGARRARVSSYGTGYSGTVDVDDIEFDTTHRLLLIRFVREQVAFDGSAHLIEVDVRGVESRNVVDEISRLLTDAGCTPDASTFATAQAYATTHGMLVDCDHGSSANGDTGQRRYRAIIEDLLFIARASLYRTATGNYAIVQDKVGTSSTTKAEAEGDLVEVLSVQSPPRPTRISISYLPNAVDPGRLTHTITRNVTGGVLGEDRPREVRYLSDHTAADRLLCYLALRAEYGRRIRFRQWLAGRSLGDIITLTSPPVGIHSALPVWVASTNQIPGGVECDSVEYNALVHTYSAGTLPADAVVSYQPDYSKTPPVAPTSLTITAGSTAVQSDGVTIARITVTAVAPAANWAALWFVAVHNVTGEMTGLMRGDLITGTTYGGTLTDLRPGEVYQLKAYATNAFNVAGIVQGTFSATAIGGGGAVTTFTAPGYATAPATVSTCTAAQGMGRLIEVNWTGVTTANLREYALERKVGAAAFVEIWRGRTRNYIDRDVFIATAYQYRVRAVDTYGNLSGSYATSGSVTPAGNVTGGNSGNDIATDTVGTPNRTGVSTASTTITTRGTLTVTHGLTRQPIATCYVNGKAGAVNWIRTLNTTTIIACAKIFGQLEGDEASGSTATTTTNNTAGSPHTHNVQDLVAIGSFSLSVDYW